LKTFTIETIRSFLPCYDPIRYLPEGWAGTVVDILKHNTIPAANKLWVVLRKECLDDRTLRLHAVNSARRALGRVSVPDPRSVEACNVGERFANGEATKQELDAAWAAAWAAARAARATRAAAWAAARAADAAWAAARAADAAWAAAWAADAAWAAAADAAWAAADAADAAARAAASGAERGAEREEQVKQLLILLGV